jgi:hypothetical protein
LEAALPPEEWAALPRTTEKTSPPRPSIRSTRERRRSTTLATTAAVESLELLIEQVHPVAEQIREAAYRMALDVYYTAEKLARDPFLRGGTLALAARPTRARDESSVGVAHCLETTL